MNHSEIRSLEDAGRSTLFWSADPFDSRSRFIDVTMALLPASLILAAAAALLVALL